ncbi:MAG: DMT family transporter [Synergistaceae bacterium]|jgi:drug/metabolite transporter (DMT)-like permease|nr:DMT family transporter [Synergistaceae bacterium]
MEKRNSFHIFALISVVGWSISYVLTRMALRHFSPYSLGFLRYIIASAVLAAIACAFSISPPARKDWGLIAASGATGFFLYMIALNTGSMTETAATNSIIIATAPIMTTLLGMILYGEKLVSAQWFAIAVEFVGIMILNVRDGNFSVGAGIFWLLLAAFLLSVFNLLQRKLTKTYTGLRVSIYSIFAGTVMLSAFVREAVEEAASADAKYLVYAALLGIFSSALSYVAWSVAIERAPRTSSASNYMFLTPLLAAVMGFVIAGELPDSGTLIGGAVILSGVFLFNRAGRPPQTPANGKTAGG